MRPSPGEGWPVCGGCYQTIDPDTCGCGSPITHYPDGHAPIPMGCDCHREPKTRTVADLDYIRPWCVGLFVGMLGDQELAAFERLVAAGVAYRSYEGAAGWLGLAKVRLVQP